MTTNPQPHNDRLATHLRAEGLAVAQWPLHAVELLVDPTQVQARLPASDWILVGSQYAIRALSACTGVESVRVAALGVATAAALRAAHVVPALQGRGGGAALAEQLCQDDLCGQRVLILQAETGCTAWHNRLRVAGALVTVLATHRLVPLARPRGREVLTAAQAVLFTAPSAVERFFTLYPGCQASEFFAIGQTTAGALQRRNRPCAGVSPMPEFSAFAKYVAMRLKA